MKRDPFERFSIGSVSPRPRGPARKAKAEPRGGGMYLHDSKGGTIRRCVFRGPGTAITLRNAGVAAEGLLIEGSDTAIDADNSDFDGTDVRIS